MLTDGSIDNLLAETPERARQREQAAFGELAGPVPDALVLCGAGNLGRKTLSGLRKLGVEPVALTDNNSALWGTAVEGVPVLSPDDAAGRYRDCAAFVVTIWRVNGSDREARLCMPKLIDEWRGRGCARVLPFWVLFWRHPDVFLPHHALGTPHELLLHADEVRQAFAMLSDDASRREFLTELRWHLRAEFDEGPAPASHEIYFPDDLVSLTDTEVFVDCGAYDGDTLRAFVARQSASSARAVGFEPDPLSRDRLTAYVASLRAPVRDRISVQPFAVGPRRERLTFVADGTPGAAVGDGALVVESVPLDEHPWEQAPTYIKMDIEGAEMGALTGAQRLIAAGQPVLAVCAYHCRDDFWQIPLLIGRASDSYRLFLRQHHGADWDLVCYGIPANRLRTET